MIKSNLLIAFSLVSLAFFVAACEPFESVRCYYDNYYAPDRGLWSCKDFSLASNPSEAQTRCENDLALEYNLGATAQFAKATCDELGPYVGKCTYSDGSVDWFVSGEAPGATECVDAIYTNQWGCEVMGEGTFECLL